MTNTGRAIVSAILGALLLSVAAVDAADPDSKTKERPTVKKTVKDLQADFRKLEFGMFIHYNMATYMNAEWVAGYHSPSNFNPGVETIDTDSWADAAKAAGIKYGVLTVKHVAGFCLWDSKHTTYDVMHPECPYKKDIVDQFVKSFTSRGLKVGLYYCWRHPGFGDPNKHKVLPPECDPAKHSLEEQNEFQKKQIAELLERYPDVFYIWNDALDHRVMPAEEILSHIRSIRPNVLASSNYWNWGKKGHQYLDVGIKELRHFPEGPSPDTRETCFKMEKAWFWKKGTGSASAKGVMAQMDAVYSRSSNYLLNVGPDPKGNIVPGSVKTLAEVGKLLAARSDGEKAE